MKKRCKKCGCFVNPNKKHICPNQKGSKNPNWKGGIAKTGNGYLWEFHPNHPFANKRGYVLQHRLVMEKYIKRFLLPQEIVHHLNEKRDDNRIENLQLLINLGRHNTIHKTKQFKMKEVEFNERLF